MSSQTRIVLSHFSARQGCPGENMSSHRDVWGQVQSTPPQTRIVELPRTYLLSTEQPDKDVWDR